MGIVRILAMILLICFGGLACLAVPAISVVAAKKLSADKGLSSGLMWLGILGWLGLVILCFIKKKDSEAPVCAQQDTDI